MGTPLARHITGFLTTENYNVDTNTLLFQQLTYGSDLALEENETEELSYALDLGDGRQLIYTYILWW